MPLVLRDVQVEPVDVLEWLRGPRVAAARQLANFRYQALERSQVVLRIPDITEDEIHPFMRMMERYFAQHPSILARDVQTDDRRVGYSDPYTEFDERLFHASNALAEDCRPYGNPHPEPDPSARFSWRIGYHPALEGDVQGDPVIPLAFKNEWFPTMDMWGHKLLQGAYTVGEMTERAFDLDPGTITNRFDGGCHFLAPTACDLLALLSHKTNIPRNELAREICDAKDLLGLCEDLNLIGHVLSQFQSDDGPMTLQGSSNFPGLIAWTRKDEPFLVRMPKGCVLAQFGQQTEHLFAGSLNSDGIRAGFHEVATVVQTIAALQRALQENRSTFRCESTLYPQFNNEGNLEVLEPYRRIPGTLETYPDTLVGVRNAEMIQRMYAGRMKH